MSLAIETHQLTKTYDGETVIDAIDFGATAGSVHAIAGPNGAGKSTMLKLIVGLIQPTKGSIHVLGDALRDGTILRQRVHYISPEVNLYPLFRVRDILTYASLLYERWDPERVRLLSDVFALPVNKFIRQLSLGMKMRLRIVIALSAKPDVLLLDEATNGIDPAAKDQFLDLVLQESANRGVTVIMATHQLSEIERVADTLSVLSGGRMVCTRDLDVLKEDVHEVFASVPSEPNQVVGQLTGVIDWTAHESRLSLIITGKRQEIVEQFASLGANFVDIHPASLDKWFQSVLKKEGVHRGKLVLPESTTV